MNPEKDIPIHSVHYLTDDRDQERRQVLHITLGGNGDFYVATTDEGLNPVRGVRICTSGGAASAVPGLGVAIAQAFLALLKAARPPKLTPPRFVNVAIDLENDEENYVELESHKLTVDADGYRWIENPDWHRAIYELGPDLIVRRRTDL